MRGVADYYVGNFRSKLRTAGRTLSCRHAQQAGGASTVALGDGKSRKKIRGVKKLGPRSSEQDFLGFSFMSVHYLITCCQEKFYKTYKLKKVTKLKSREEAPEERSER